MTATAKPDQLLFRFRPADSGNGVSHATLARLAEYLGLSETQAMHYALKKLAAEVLPAYETDDGELSPQQMDCACAFDRRAFSGRFFLRRGGAGWLAEA